LFFFFLSFFRFGKFFTLFFFRDKKNRFYASVGAQVENTHKKKLSTSTCAFARAVEGTIDAALFDDRGRDEGCWCPRPFLGRRFRKVAKTPARVIVFSYFSFLLPPRQGKVGISSVRFFFSPKTRARERVPPLKKLKITRALRSNEETRDSRSKLLFIRIKFFTRATQERRVARWWTWKRACSPERRSRSLKYRAIP